MDSDTVTSSVCGTAHFEELPVYVEQQKKIQSNQKTEHTVLPPSFQEKCVFSSTQFW